MRVRFFPSLDSDTNALIMSYMLRIDLALMRVVCSEWRKWIPPQRLTFEKDFRNIPEHYNRLEYIASIEKNIVFPSKLDETWAKRNRMDVINTCARVYTLMFYYRKIRCDLDIVNVWNRCVFEEIEPILLPMLMARPQWISHLFWGILPLDKKCVTDTLDWIEEKGFVSNYYGAFFDKAIMPSRLNDIVLSHLKYLHNRKKIMNWFWTSYLDFLWRNVGDVNKTIIFDLAIMCNYVPPVACSKVTDAEHERIIHICGCEKVVTYKKRKV